MENIRRYGLFAAIAVVSYLILQQWNEDYGQAEPQPQVFEQEVQQNSDTAPVVSSENKEAVDSSVQPVGGELAQEQPTQEFNSSLITVKTDTFDILIDPNGGDIVYAAIPKYPFSIDQPDVPFVMLEKNARRTYVAQSGFWGDRGYDQGGRTQYVSEVSSYEMTNGELDVLLTANVDGIEFNKIYTFTKGSYLVKVTNQVVNNSDSVWNGRVFNQIKRDKTSDPSGSTGIGMASYLGFAWTTDESRYEKLGFGKLDDKSFEQDKLGGWVAFLQHYFLSSVIPDQEIKSSYFVQKDKNSSSYRGGFYNSLTVIPQESGEISAEIYIGPKLQNDLREIVEHLDLTVDYGWLWFIAQPLFWLLTFIHGLVGNWGWSIILLTLVIKGAFYPLTAASYRSMGKMKKFAPKMTQLREQYGDDRQKLSQEMMKLYQKEKINPMGGCLPMLVQMPVFIALYWTLMEAVELRQSPFMFWIVDLSIKDPTFILPLLMGASMFVQMQLGTQPQDPTQAKIMKFMPVIFTVMFLWFPSGLVLYWLVNNLLSIAQQWYINKQLDAAENAKS